MPRHSRSGSFLALLLAGVTLHGSADRAADDWGIPHFREREDIRRAMVREKLDDPLVHAMRAANVDMWLILDRENAPDPMRHDVGGGYAGGGAAFIFHDGGGAAAEAIHVAPSEQPLDSVIAQAFDTRITYGSGGQAAFSEALGRVVAERRPARIAVNQSVEAGGASGLSAAGARLLREALGETYGGRLVSSEDVAHRFRGRRTDTETTWYRRLQAWTARWQSEALTAGSLGRGGTTVRDLVSGLEDKAAELGLEPITDHGRYPLIVWFGHHSVMPGLTGFDRPPVAASGNDPRAVPLVAGDLVTLDGGLRAFGLSSDMKRSAYVLRPGERTPPPALRAGWQRLLQAADICAARLRTGRTGREASRLIAADAEAAGFSLGEHPNGGSYPQLVLYGHAVGNDVHDIGARLTFAPEAGARDWALLDGEWISVEFHVVVPGDAKTPWRLRFEQTGQVRAGGFEWLVPLQRELALIDPPVSRKGDQE